MSTEPEGVESDSEAVLGANALRSENEMAQKSENLADNEAQDLVVKLTGAERRGCVSAGDDETETRNGFCDLREKTESKDVETNGGEIENNTSGIHIVCSHGDNLCNGVVDSDEKSEDVDEKRDLVGSGKQKPKPENLNGVVLTGSAAANENLKLSDSDLVSKEKVSSHGDKQEPKLENLKLSDSDLVWAKVMTYPWWPGQVFESSAASKKAKKYYKKGKSLVMYFGDCSFAWNDSSCIKPFHQFFSQMVNQSKTTEFRNAIDCALEEVSRRVEFGLSCSCCISQEAYNNLKTQKIMNPGIRKDSSVRYGGDKLSNAMLFKPVKVFEYLKDLACFPSYDANDKLLFVSNRARILAFQQWQRYRTFPKYETFIKSLESEASIPELSSKKRKSGYDDNDEEDKERFGFEDKTDEKKKKKTLLDFIAEKRFEMSNSEKKRKAESLKSEKNKKTEKRKHNEELAPEKISSSSSSPDVEMISSLHSDKTGKGIVTESSTSKDPWNYDNFVKELSRSSNNLNDDSKKTSSETDEMVSSLHNVKTRTEIIPESISIDPSNYQDLEKFMKELSCSNLNDVDLITMSTEASESPNVQTGLKDITGSDSKEQPGFKDITGSGSKEETGLLKDSSSDSLAATALILNFADSGSVPSVEKLNKIFSHYGSLIESETKMIKKNGKRVKVVFERSEDAKTAFSSAGKYSIFGPSLLSYKLKFVSIKTKQRKKKMTKTEKH